MTVARLSAEMGCVEFEYWIALAKIDHEEMQQLQANQLRKAADREGKAKPIRRRHG